MGTVLRIAVWFSLAACTVASVLWVQSYAMPAFWSYRGATGEPAPLGSDEALVGMVWIRNVYLCSANGVIVVDYERYVSGIDSGRQPTFARLRDRAAWHYMMSRYPRFTTIIPLGGWSSELAATGSARAGESGRTRGRLQFPCGPVLHIHNLFGQGTDGAGKTRTIFINNNRKGATMNTMTVNSRSERLTRLGILREPLGYVEGGDVHEYVKCNRSETYRRVRR
jgi:hypothetical protein